jgi:hypothetical protein
MPFGKFQGRQLGNIPTDYLQWLLDHFGGLRQPLLGEVEKELAGRMPAAAPPEPRWEELVRTWHSRLVLEFGPARGGSAEAMRAIDQGRDLLRQLLEEWQG